MNVSSTAITAFGSAAIASPPADSANAKTDDKTTEPPRAEPVVEAAKPAGTGQFVDKTV